MRQWPYFILFLHRDKSINYHMCVRLSISYGSVWSMKCNENMPKALSTWAKSNVYHCNGWHMEVCIPILGAFNSTKLWTLGHHKNCLVHLAIVHDKDCHFKFQNWSWDPKATGGQGKDSLSLGPLKVIGCFLQVIHLKN